MLIEGVNITLRKYKITDACLVLFNGTVITVWSIFKFSVVRRIIANSQIVMRYITYNNKKDKRATARCIFP